MLLKKIKFLDGYKLLCVFNSKEKVIWDAEKSLKDRYIWNMLKDINNFNKLHVVDGVLLYCFSDEENDYFEYLLYNSKPFI